MKKVVIKETEETKLPKLFKRKWLKALRSGKYEQGTGTLRRQTASGILQYCCLGVAAEVAGCTFRGNPDYIENDKKNKVIGITKIPKIIVGDNDNPVVETLSNMNDRGKTFDEIADYIEKNL